MLSEPGQRQPAEVLLPFPGKSLCYRSHKKNYAQPWCPLANPTLRARSAANRIAGV